MAHTEEMLIHGIMTPVSVFDSSAQEIDDTVGKVKQGAAGVGALPLAGGTVKTSVSVGVTIQRQSNTEYVLAAIGFGRLNANYGHLGLSSVNIPEFIDTSGKEYRLLHTGNKPSGSYTGTGAFKTIPASAGLTTAIIIICELGFAVLPKQMPGVFVGRDGVITALPQSAAWLYNSGNIELYAADSIVNRVGVEYRWTVI